LVVADPPRAGLGAEVCKLLAQVGPAEIVYVSCDPVTLGRDLAALVESGYRLRALHLVDLFAQTFHMETVAELARA
jgi:23S rRNA (uracil1939-C5)-methyltransferase